MASFEIGPNMYIAFITLQSSRCVQTHIISWHSQVGQGHYLWKQTNHREREIMEFPYLLFIELRHALFLLKAITRYPHIFFFF